MRVLGVDPGLTRCGIGVVDGGPGQRPQMIEVVVVRTAPGTDLAERLLTIAEQVEAIMDRLQPDTVAIERMFSQHNVRTVMGTAQASGLALHAAAARGLPVGLHTPSEVKAAITGYGNADKRQVQAMVARVLGLAEAPKPADAAEAVERWRSMRGRSGVLHTGHWLVDDRGDDAGGTGATLGAVSSATSSGSASTASGSSPATARRSSSADSSSRPEEAVLTSIPRSWACWSSSFESTPRSRASS